MRILLSTVGSRGDVQPLLALAIELKELGQEVSFCVPPDFREWLEGAGFQVTPIGPEVRRASAGRPASTGAASAPPSPEMIRRMAEGTIAAQFPTITEAAKGCDMIVGATALQLAAPSVAERLGIPYAFAVYCPVSLPSPHHAPPPLSLRGDSPVIGPADHRALWEKDAERWNDTFLAALNVHRETAGLPPIDDVRGHVLTDHPWLAADPTLGPWPAAGNAALFQTGAWMVRDERPLDPEIERFLDAGDPPVYFGFGSMRAPANLSRAMIEASRAAGRRAIVSRGWADLELVDDAEDCFAIGEVNQQALFPRVAAIVHHGGAGTTTAAARSGSPQVIIPQMYDQHYWGRRVRELGIGSAHAHAPPSADSLALALREALNPETVRAASALAPSIRTDGARVAAERILAKGRM